ncbi:MAG: Maf family protein [Porticoccaceae bacterium]|nr:Maf family protein [Porticoccaceae bacterium]
MSLSPLTPTDLKNADLILASASPRRSDLLKQIGVHFVIAAADIDESQRSAEPAIDYVARLALEKAQAGWHRHMPTIPVLGADTIGLWNSKVFGKPTDCDEAVAMLQSLSASTHQVLSAVAIVNEQRSEVAISKTSVTFRTISVDECLRYWKTGEPQGKAGAYAVQGFGATFVAHLEGSYSGVVGLPLLETQRLLEKFNVPTWQQ